MTGKRPDPSVVVRTEAELPPGMDAPSPAAERERIAAGGGVPADVEREIRRLADRVGGPGRLRELLDRLAAAGL